VVTETDNSGFVAVWSKMLCPQESERRQQARSKYGMEYNIT
jgi:hypothetical protein